MNWSFIPKVFGARGRYRHRLIAGVLLVSLPITGGLVLMLTRDASRHLTSSAKKLVAEEAETVSEVIDGWFFERRSNMDVVATLIEARLGQRNLRRLIQRVEASYGAYDIIQLSDLTGRPIAASNARTFDPGGREWFAEAAAGKPVLSPLYRDGASLRWVIAHPVLDQNGRPTAVVMGDLDVVAVADFLHEDFGRTAESLLVAPGNLLIATSKQAGDTDEAELIASGALRERVDSLGIRRALSGEKGAAEYVDYRGREVLGGYAPVEVAGIAGVVNLTRAEALAAVADQRRSGLVLVAGGTLILVLFAALFARHESRNLKAMVDESTAAGQEVTVRSAALSSSSEELAATSSEQTAAVAETSATMEELARAAASIADTVDRVASQTAETRSNLEGAEADIQSSSQRTLALAERAKDIGAMLELITEIAEQTNLLALNAAIEAARAGEAGRGFAVVAEEVRRLAERSKSSATEIDGIVQGVQEETNATVMSMEQGARQMQGSMSLVEQVTEAAMQVRLTTQQQRSATEQAVSTIEQLMTASRQVTVTAQEIATASSALTTLASNLEDTSAAAKSRL